MTTIVPSIIAQNFSAIEDKLKILAERVPWAHLDIMDGRFVPETTWSAPDDLEIINGRIKLEAHLMVERPEELLAIWVSAVDRVIVHAEATDCLGEMVESLTGHACELGVALKIATPLTVLEEYLPQISFVQLMSINEIGHYQGDFSSEIYEKVTTLRERWPKGIISIDGGINAERAKRLSDLGANQLVVGSAIWQSADPLAALAQFQFLGSANDGDK